MVFSDVHANLAALEAVLKHAVEQNIHRTLCLGDLVGYGPHPNECIQLVRDLPNCRCTGGNHDVASLWETSPYGMSPAAKEVILWTMDQLSEENKKYLSSLPDRLDLADMTFVHANPYNPRGWRYVMDRKFALRSFGSCRCRLLFIGHSHRPLVITRKRLLSVDLEPVSGSIHYPVNDRKRRIINCGSVGQSRDRDVRACYLVLDTRKKRVEFHRVTYPVDITVQRIKAAGLPELLMRRLEKGI